MHILQVPASEVHTHEAAAAIGAVMVVSAYHVFTGLACRCVGSTG